LLVRIEQSHGISNKITSQVDRRKGKAREFRPERLAGVDPGSLRRAQRQSDVSSRSLRLGGGRAEPIQGNDRPWLWPDSFRNQDTSALKAKKAIADYKKAMADAAGLAELMVFYCEQAAGFSSDLGYQDESYFDALVRMFNQAVATANRLPVGSRDALIVRLDRVRSISHELGYGVGDDMDSILAKYTKRKV
jgi:hypothetical protein